MKRLYGLLLILPLCYGCFWNIDNPNPVPIDSIQALSWTQDGSKIIAHRLTSKDGDWIETYNASGSMMMRTKASGSFYDRDQRLTLIGDSVLTSDYSGVRIFSSTDGSSRIIIPGRNLLGVSSNGNSLLCDSLLYGRGPYRRFQIYSRNNGSWIPGSPISVLADEYNAKYFGNGLTGVDIYDSTNQRFFCIYDSSFKLLFRTSDSDLSSGVLGYSAIAQRVLFKGSVYTGAELRVIDLRSGVEHDVPFKKYSYEGDISPKGDFIVYADSVLKIRNLTTNAENVIPDFYGGCMQISPDGSKLAVCEGNAVKVIVLNIP